MKVLVAIPHYFKPKPNSRHSSTDGARKEQRAQAIKDVILGYRGLFGGTSKLNINTLKLEPHLGPDIEVQLVVTVYGEDHVLDAEFCKIHQVSIVQVQVSDARLLGFAVQNLLAENRSRFDYFVFCEDDLRMHDPFFFNKLQWFNAQFGWRRLLMPNRVEWHAKIPTVKTYIDGELLPKHIQHYLDAMPDETFLQTTAFLEPVIFEQTRNPHAGFYALSAEQLHYWMKQPHFGDGDMSFFTPLESSATLGVMKTFPIYKAYGRDACFLELEHLDDRYSVYGIPKNK
jgi:hypothetical protein